MSGTGRGRASAGAKAAAITSMVSKSTIPIVNSSSLPVRVRVTAVGADSPAASA
jgi:hypothetical protein